MIYAVIIPGTDERAHAANQYGPAPDHDFQCCTEIQELPDGGWLICCSTPSGREEPDSKFFRVRVYSFAADGTPVYEGECPLHERRGALPRIHDVTEPKKCERCGLIVVARFEDPQRCLDKDCPLKLKEPASDRDRDCTRL